jgi:hypothetical protein
VKCEKILGVLLLLVVSFVAGWLCSAPCPKPCPTDDTFICPCPCDCGCCMGQMCTCCPEDCPCPCGCPTNGPCCCTKDCAQGNCCKKPCCKPKAGPARNGCKITPWAKPCKDKCCPD